MASWIRFHQYHACGASAVNTKRSNLVPLLLSHHFSLALDQQLLAVLSLSVEWIEAAEYHQVQSFGGGAVKSRST